jgi:hypothetical protein
MDDKKATAPLVFFLTHTNILVVICTPIFDCLRNSSAKMFVFFLTQKTVCQIASSCRVKAKLTLGECKVLRRAFHYCALDSPKSD